MFITKQSVLVVAEMTVESMEECSERCVACFSHLERAEEQQRVERER